MGMNTTDVTIFGGYAALFSMTGSFIIILSFILIPRIRNKFTTMVFFLSISDFFFSSKYFAVGLVFSDSCQLQNNFNYCYVEAAWSQFFGMASISWTAVIALELLITTQNPLMEKKNQRTSFYHLYVWGMATITSCLMVYDYEDGTLLFGPSGDGTCWTKPGKFTSGLLFYGPLGVYFLLSLVVMTILIRSLITLDSRKAGMLRFRFMGYIGIFIIVWLGPISNGIGQYLAIYILDNDEKLVNNLEQCVDTLPTWVMILHTIDSIGVGCLGAANSLVWITDPSFYDAIYSKVVKLFGCCFSSQEKVAILPTFEYEVENVGFYNLNDQLRGMYLNCIVKGIYDSIGNDTNHKVYDEDFMEAEAVTNTLPGQNQSDVEYTFTEFAPHIFQKIRLLSGMTAEEYRRGINPRYMKEAIEKVKGSDGRSASFFCWSADKKFIIKTIPQYESEKLRDILPVYYDHLNADESLLVKFYGSYMIELPQSEPLYIIVMNNCHPPNMEMDEKYDLKGSWIARGGNLDVTKLGKDTDLINTGQDIHIGINMKQRLLEVISRDIQMLRDVNIMDYSLFLGIKRLQEETGTGFEASSTSDDNLVELEESLGMYLGNINSDPDSSLSLIPSVSGDCLYAIGIIDILQEYNTDKKQEHCFKVTCLRKDKKGISCVEPDYYCTRFYEAMERVFV
eukprot:TRINITY_DN5338_c0_g1_i1.p1 TRINITY_DN5338_c0_g1~~TRINITY_DN5338_c0_g1_i1.p1  ORF type:complete len:678 (-),score=125.49 TRINITY_DN5338_c0_g1_i1:209-2242(-)